MVDREAEKQLVARRAVKYVQDGMRVGLGTGSTAVYAIRYLGDRVHEEGLKVTGVATSPASRELAMLSGIPLAEDLEGFTLDLTIDGADQATRAGEMIKGGNGALLHERIVGGAARRYIIICDSSKLVDRLGSAPLPVEVSRFGWRNALARLEAQGCRANVRRKDGSQFFITEEGNYIIDCQFPPDAFPQPDRLSQVIREIPGVADVGLFLNMVDLLLIARGDQVEEIATSRA
jgi:ribose 5-phosphate isomerase A